MKKLILLLLIGVAGWQIYTQQNTPVITNADLKLLNEENNSIAPSNVRFSQIYTCDGREYCSQMHSCEEATFFIENCPNTKMDGNYDGVPCERQWCK